jgi:N-acetylglucosamine kinase-like BadF-type ATPase
MGVDAGGTKTIAAICEPGGRVQGIGLAGSANFQTCGVAGARAQINLAVSEALKAAGAEPNDLASVCYGVAGADRPRDFETVQKFTETLTFCQNYRLENDTIIALRAGTRDGVGIALIAGTGSNAIGRTGEGATLQVGGLGPLSGDYGSAGQLSEAAVAAAIMGQDGRGPATALTGLIKNHLGLKEIEDIIEYFFYDSKHPPLDLGSLAPLIFEAAANEDQAALTILQEAGKSIAKAVRVITNQLFPVQEKLIVVFGGSVFQKAKSLALIDTVVQECKAHRPQTRFKRLEVEPVLGAVKFAFDDAGWPITDEIWVRMKASFARLHGSGTP